MKTVEMLSPNGKARIFVLPRTVAQREAQGWKRADQERPAATRKATDKPKEDKDSE